ncbi:MAG: glycosyltransferase [Limnohabitans sp.]
MTTVHFVHTGSAYMPELTAYEEHLQQLGHSSQRHKDARTVPNQAAIVWWICGRVSRQHAQRLDQSLHVHEYASASVAPVAWLKDRIKQHLNPTPHYRIFQSEWVRQRSGLTDNRTPYCFRDMGVPPQFLIHQAQHAPEFDLVYLGAMSRLAAFTPTLKAIHQSGLQLLLVGDIPEHVQHQLKDFNNIHTTGRIEQHQVPDQLYRARCGLNLMPDTLPLSEQTSTKMLEYLALGLPVISNAYGWALRYKTAYPQRIQILDSNSPPEAWTQALQKTPKISRDRHELHALAWPELLTQMPIWQYLQLSPQKAIHGCG